MSTEQISPNRCESIRPPGVFTTYGGLPCRRRTRPAAPSWPASPLLPHLPRRRSAPSGSDPIFALIEQPDPIFAAIENNRKADAECIRLYEVEAELEESGKPIGDHPTAEMVAAVDASIQTRELLAKTAPTTLAGLVVYLDYVRDWSNDEYLFADDREAMDFLESLQRTVHGLNAGAAS
jgi:hypothetical protein